MTRCPRRACASLTPGPTAATTPQGSWPAITGSPRPRIPIAVLPPPAARYECRSLPHMPEALISNTTSPGPGVGSGNSRSSNRRSPRNTTPRISSPYQEPGRLSQLPLLLAQIIDCHPPSGHGRFGVGDISTPEHDGVVGIASSVRFDDVLAQ